MGILYKKTENLFEKFSIKATRLLGNSITFIIALILVALDFTRTFPMSIGTAWQ